MFSVNKAHCRDTQDSGPFTAPESLVLQLFTGCFRLFPDIPGYAAPYPFFLSGYTTGLLTRAPKGSLLDADQGARLDAD